jgi:hypothetical protein
MITDKTRNILGFGEPLDGIDVDASWVDKHLHVCVCVRIREEKKRAKLMLQREDNIYM